MTQQEKEVHLALSGRIVFEQDISVAQGALVISTLQSGPGADIPLPGPEPPALPPAPAGGAEKEPREAPAIEEGRRQGQVESPRQALERSDAKTIPEKMTAFAAYLLQEEGREAFTQSDIRRLFQRARERIPSHFSREFDKAVRAGWIHEGEEKGQCYVSESAKDVIEDGFSSLRGRSSRKRDSSAPSAGKSGRKKVRAVPVPEVFAELDNIPSTIDGVAPYYRVGLKRDKLLWALQLARDLGLPGLQSTEVAWLTDRLGDAIPTRDMNGHFKGLQRSGYANRSMVGNIMRITEAGEEYLRTL
ncbi:hypothetical protein [Streptomyces sp. 43Y-GA-1]|uniref:hypothetical protein n=1 Tax=Streptomyces sp. 43Y-GA-1 TaxID=2939435 RepID=UPI0020C08A2B|nr:hypothetical protein [Streptomyces sp. 43Y-GA-1]MCL6291664.1 hypothetical protein [Streptomyces sp. 43Y-GA-1]